MELLLCFHNSSLEQLGQVIGIGTPIILLFWFLYTQYQSYTRNYFREIEGIYAGFTESGRNLPGIKGINAGIIMYIRDVDNKGFFKGEFEFGEMTLTIQNKIPIERPLSAGIHTFLGKLNYKFYKDKSRHPLRVEENRVYTGRLYIIDRLDFQFETIKMEQYLQMEYDIIHFRELKALKFTLVNIHKETAQKLPKQFTLYKSGGFAFEPLKGVQDVIFKSFNA
jgi:hypothetical protein